MKLRKISTVLVLSCVTLAAGLYLSQGVSAARADDDRNEREERENGERRERENGERENGEGGGQNAELEGKIRQLEQVLQKLRQERLSRPSDVLEAAGAEGCDHFDELEEIWDEVLNSLGDMADRGECDDDLFENESDGDNNDRDE